MSAKRLARRRRYERALGTDYRGRYGFTARHVRCDRCHVNYLPQHVHRVARWLWWCGNCQRDTNCGIVVEQRARLRHRYADDHRMLEALGFPRSAAIR